MKTQYPYLAFLAIVAALIAMLISVSCSRRSVPISHRTDSIGHLIIRERITDTMIVVREDSSAITYLIECKGERARLVEMLNYEAGRAIQPPKIVIKDNYITTKCLVDSQAVYARIKATDTTRLMSTKTVIVEVKKEPSPWQWAQIWLGRLTIAILLIYLLVSIVRRWRVV